MVGLDKFLTQINETQGEVLDDILLRGNFSHGVAPEDLHLFVESIAKRARLGRRLEKAITVAVKKGFSAGYLELKPGFRKEFTESLSGLFHLLSAFYQKTVVFVDQLDTVWTKMKPRERGQFVGAMSDFVRLSVGTCVLVLTAYREITVQIGGGESYKEAPRTLPITQSNVIDVPSFNDYRQVVKVLESYLNADAYRGEHLAELETQGYDQLYPFTEEGIRILSQHFQGNISRILLLAHDLIKVGQRDEYPLLDREYVTCILGTTPASEPLEPLEEGEEDYVI